MAENVSLFQFVNDKGKNSLIYFFFFFAFDFW
jgi:hypothetical protein